MDWTKIRQMRKAAGVTQEQLANKLGVNRATISKYESGQIEPTISMLETIASVLGVHIFDLVGSGDELDRYAHDVAKTQTDVRGMYDSLSAAEKSEFWKIGIDCENDMIADVSKIAQDYANLDQWGKQTVRAVIAAEQDRMKNVATDINC